MVRCMSELGSGCGAQAGRNGVVRVLVASVPPWIEQRFNDGWSDLGLGLEERRPNMEHRMVAGR